MNLTRSQRDTPVWSVIEKHLRERLDTLRRQNDKQDNEAATQLLRGRIVEVKALLSIGDDPPAI